MKEALAQYVSTVTTGIGTLFFVGLVVVMVLVFGYAVLVRR